MSFQYFLQDGKWIAVETADDIQAADSDLTAIAALSTTPYGRNLLTLADAASGRTNLALGTAATHPATDFDLSGAAATAQAASQPLDSDLTAIAALSTTTYGRALLAAADAAAGRTALGLGTAATQASTAFDGSGAAAAAQSASQPVDSDLTAIAALATTTFGRSLLANADAAAVRAALSDQKEIWESQISPNQNPVASAGGAVTYLAAAGPGAAGVFINTATNNNATMTYRANVSPGTWTMNYWFTKISNLGIVKVETSDDEGSTWTQRIAALDLYAVAQTNSQVSTVAGIVVAAGKYTLLVRVTSTGKNASASNYIPLMGEVTLSRTA